LLPPATTATSLISAGIGALLDQLPRPLIVSTDSRRTPLEQAMTNKNSKVAPAIARIGSLFMIASEFDMKRVDYGVAGESLSRTRVEQRAP
jgi:hypothetical protein